jgi:hypothetical protein
MMRPPFASAAGRVAPCPCCCFWERRRGPDSRRFTTSAGRPPCTGCSPGAPSTRWCRPQAIRYRRIRRFRRFRRLARLRRRGRDPLPPRRTFKSPRLTPPFSTRPPGETSRPTSTRARPRRRTPRRRRARLPGHRRPLPRRPSPSARRMRLRMTCRPTRLPLLLPPRPVPGRARRAYVKRRVRAHDTERIRSSRRVPAASGAFRESKISPPAPFSSPPLPRFLPGHRPRHPRSSPRAFSGRWVEPPMAMEWTNDARCCPRLVPPTSPPPSTWGC